MTDYPLTMYGIREARPGPRWRELFEATWPAYRRWYLREGRAKRPTSTAAATALARHMPELLPTWAQLAEQTGFDDEAIAMLSHWNLPAFAPAGCSQAVTTEGGPALVRNYDYRPDLFECVSMSTRYLQPVIGTSDCLWGLLDGMNAAGLAVSLAFGGDREVGEGFAIPLVVRYLLEVCTSVAQAEHTLQRLPVAMSYNLTMIDSSGASGTVHVGPGRTAQFRNQPLATNHRWQRPRDPAHARRYRSVERFDRLSGLLDRRASPDDLATAMLTPPLYARDYSHGFGTLYTAVYRLQTAVPPHQTALHPAAVAELTYRWPARSWRRTFDTPEGTVQVALTDA